MQMRKILILSTVDDETIGFEIEFVHKIANRRIQVCEEGGIIWVEFCKRFGLSLGDDKHVKLVAGSRMLKRNQVRGLAEACSRDEETHVSENPADDPGDEAEMEKFTHHVIRNP